VAIPNNTAANGNCSAVPGWQTCGGTGGPPTTCTNVQIASGYNPYRTSFIVAMNGTATAANPINGGFLTSCHTHCEAQSGDFAQFSINGVLMWQAVDTWLNATGTQPAGSNFYWDCAYNATASKGAYNCNPSCL
jgi:hypothetical protein